MVVTLSNSGEIGFSDDAMARKWRNRSEESGENGSRKKTSAKRRSRSQKVVATHREDVERCDIQPPTNEGVMHPSGGRPSTSRHSSRRNENEGQAPMPSSSRPVRRRNDSEEPVPNRERPVRRRNDSEEELYERERRPAPVRASRRSSSIRSNRKNATSIKHDYEEEERRERRRANEYEEEERRERRRASSRPGKMREESRVVDNERRYRRHSRDSKHHERRERRTSRSDPFPKSDSSDSETEMRRYRRKYTYKPDSDVDSGSERRKGKRLGPSKGEIFLKSLKEAKNICFFKNPFFEEDAQYTGDFLMNNIQQSQMQKMQQMQPSKDTWLYNYGDGESKNAKPNLPLPPKTPIAPLRDSVASEKKTASSPNFPAEKKTVKPANYRHIQPNFAQAMRNQVNNPYVPSYAYPSFAQPTCMGYKQKYNSSMYSPRKTKSEVDT